jgi:hypothetical protein
MSKNIMHNLKLSSFLGSIREFFQLKNKATFWFGAIVALVEENANNQLENNLSTFEFVELINILNQALVSIISFYQ